MLHVGAVASNVFATMCRYDNYEQFATLVSNITCVSATFSECRRGTKQKMVRFLFGVKMAASCGPIKTKVCL